MRAILFLACVHISTSANAQCYQNGVPCGAVDKNYVDASVAAVQALIPAVPPVCTSTPANPTLNGTSGVGTACVPKTDAAAQTPVQAINTTLNTDCSWAVTFARPTTSATPIVHAIAKLATGATQPIPCSPIAISSTGASGKCFPGQTTALNLSIVTAGVSLNPFAQTCTAGMTIMVNVREPTQ